MEDPNIREHMQQLFEGFEAEPPAAVWAQVEQKITGARRRKPILWFSFSAAAAVALILLLVLKKAPESVPTPYADDNGYPPLSPKSATAPKTPENVAQATVKPLVIKSKDITPGKKHQQKAHDTTADQNGTSRPQESPKNAVFAQSNSPIFGLRAPEKGRILLAQNTQTLPPAQVIRQPVRRAAASIAETPGSHTNINLNEISFQEVATLASNRFNRIVDSPLEVTHEQYEDGLEHVTYELDLKLFKITRKTSRTPKVN